jgi:hypothetical protein
MRLDGPYCQFGRDTESTDDTLPRNEAHFYILLTVRLVMVLGKWPIWRTVLFYVFISILYMFRAISCSSSGESVVSIQHLVYVTLCRSFLSDLHTKRSPTQSDIYQMLYWYNWFSWWWTRGCSKHVGNLNKYIENNCAPGWSFITKWSTFIRPSVNHDFSTSMFCFRRWHSEARPALRPIHPLHSGYRLLAGGKAAGAWR